VKPVKCAYKTIGEDGVYRACGASFLCVCVFVFFFVVANFDSIKGYAYERVFLAAAINEISLSPDVSFIGRYYCSR
jgi:hypothetical protein